MKILVCFDGSASSEKVLECVDAYYREGFFSRLVRRKKHEFTLLYVGKKDVKSEYYKERIDEEIKHLKEIKHKEWKDPSQEILERGERILGRAGIVANIRFVEGDPATEIIKESHEGYDLIIIGSQGSGGLKFLTHMGSTSTHVVNAAKIPVLVVKTGEGMTDTFKN